MRNCIITFRSVTPAQRAEEVLHRAGVECTLQRTPKWMEEKGCGYSVRLQREDLMAAAVLLRQAGIGFRKAYALADSGAPEELRL
ncbi:MAG: DUF3343 domain-containing protein [Oscillospiraceae bacterium]|nr:DUF3343 domain-containing protein [Oscillospiraceae bacterium]